MNSAVRFVAIVSLSSVCLLGSGAATAALPASAEKLYFLDFDDTNLIFENLYRADFGSIWQEPILATLKRVHDRFGTVFLMPTFFESNAGGFVLRDLAECLEGIPDGICRSGGRGQIYRGEFQAASEWLRFSFHSRDWQHVYPAAEFDQKSMGPEPRERTGDMYADYVLIRDMIHRICGPASWSDALTITHFIMGQRLPMRRLSDDFDSRIWGTFAPGNYHFQTETNYYFSRDERHWSKMLRDQVDYDLASDTWFILEDFVVEDEVRSGRTWPQDLTPEQAGNILVVISHEGYLAAPTPPFMAFIEDAARWAQTHGYIPRFPTVADLQETNPAPMSREQYFAATSAVLLPLGW